MPLQRIRVKDQSNTKLKINAAPVARPLFISASELFPLKDIYDAVNKHCNLDVPLTEFCMRGTCLAESQRRAVQFQALRFDYLIVCPSVLTLVGQTTPPSVYEYSVQTVSLALGLLFEDVSAMTPGFIEILPHDDTLGCLFPLHVTDQLTRHCDVMDDSILSNAINSSSSRQYHPSILYFVFLVLYYTLCRHPLTVLVSSPAMLTLCSVLRMLIQDRHIFP